MILLISLYPQTKLAVDWQDELQWDFNNLYYLKQINHNVFWFPIQNEEINNNGKGIECAFVHLKAKCCHYISYNIHKRAKSL
jgi:hypothetical protein